MECTSTCIVPLLVYSDLYATFHTPTVGCLCAVAVYASLLLPVHP